MERGARGCESVHEENQATASTQARRHEQTCVSGVLKRRCRLAAGGQDEGGRLKAQEEQRKRKEVVADYRETALELIEGRVSSLARACVVGGATEGVEIVLVLACRWCGARGCCACGRWVPTQNPDPEAWAPNSTRTSPTSSRACRARSCANFRRRHAPHRCIIQPQQSPRHH